MLSSLRPFPLVLLVGLLVGCQTGAPTGSPTPSPSPTPTPSPSPSPTVSGIEHSTDPSAVILRMESGGGFVPMEFLLTQAPSFTLYGDGTVIYQQSGPGDPFAGGLPPYLVGHMDEEGIQALLRFALGEGRLLGAKANYENNTVADAGSTIFTVNAGGLNKTVSVYALGMDDPNLQADAADRRGFSSLADTLRTFEQRGTTGELGEVTEYDPSHYRVFLLPAEGVQVVPQDWPWDDLTPADFKAPGENDTRASANLDKAHVAELVEVPTGGQAGIYLVDADDNLYSVGVRPLFPDELAAAGL